MAQRLAAVTGGTGFLGRWIVRELAANGWRVRVLARRDVIHPLWRDIEVEVVPGDLRDETALVRLGQGADLVVHGAGLIKASDRQAFFAVNEAGAARMARHTPAAMLLISSLAAREPQLSDYAASKRAGEDAARAILGERLGVVRPPALYGPDDPETLPLFKLAASSPVLPLLDPRARLAMMHVADAARQIAALAEQPMGFTLALSDARPDGYGWREIMATAAATFDATPRFVRVPALALHAIAALGGFSARPAMLTPGKAREILHLDWSVASYEQMCDLPPPLFDLPQGFLNSVQGYKTSGVVFAKLDKHAKDAVKPLGERA
ncbi:SDR family NAD(P)-dependent oxidoreductase [Phenylobacterium sp.]|uniref:NAD-dependent epimerase/dehydratase family protein n=1 Tax=Phenylobacterium sp. TaxID=1871053 RepID=UPI00286B3919|nr:SDR family NAD(P)-dependent oxidoreductase [Phenylobacterium sp.]